MLVVLQDRRLKVPSHFHWGRVHRQVAPALILPNAPLYGLAIPCSCNTKEGKVHCNMPPSCAMSARGVPVAYDWSDHYCTRVSPENLSRSVFFVHFGQRSHSCIHFTDHI